MQKIGKGGWSPKWDKHRGRRRNWTWMILVGSFQLGAFYDPVILRTR